MYHISRVCVGNYGHSDARFKSSLADFRKHNGKTAGSVMLYAQNGNGKTTFLSFMLHLFSPKKTKFIQSLQKPQHSIEDYFKEGEPGFIIMELVRKERALLNTDKPAVFIGAIVERRGDELSERFFIVDPRSGMRMEDIDFIKPILKRERANVTKDQVDTWIKTNRTRNDVDVFDTQAAWAKALTSWGFNLKSFEAMITMASKEGGIEKFLESSNPDDILKRVFDLFTDDKSNQAVIEELESFIEENADIPQIQRTIDVEKKILVKERALTTAAKERAENKTKLELAIARTAGLLSGIKNRIAEITTEHEELTSDLKAKKTKTAESTDSLLKAQIAQEAHRIHKTRKELKDCEETLKSLSAQKSELERERHLLECVPEAQRVTDATSARDNIRSQLEEVNNQNRDRYAPLQQAGTAYILALKSEIAFLKAKNSELDQLISNNTNAVETLEREGRETAVQITLKQNKLSEAEGARAKISETLAQISTVSGIDCPDIGTAEETRDKLAAAVASKKEALAALKRDVETNKALQIGAEREIKRYQDDLKTAQGDVTSAKQALDSYNESEAALRAEHLEYLKPGEVWDIEDETLDATLENDEEYLQNLHRQAVDEVGRLDDQIAILKSTGMFDDKDVQKALELCRQAGVSDVSTYPSWISSNMPTAEEARSFTEGNLHFTLGLKVNNENDLAKIKKTFDRSKWQLNKPVPVTVLRRADEIVAHSEQQFILSAATDYAYHEPTRAAELLKAEDVKLKAEEKRGKVADLLARTKSFEKAIQKHRRTFSSKKRENLREAIELASMKVTHQQESLDSAAARLEDLKTAVAELHEKTKPAEAKINELEALAKQVDLLFSTITRHLVPADLDTHLPSLRNEIDTLQAQLNDTREKIKSARAQSEEHGKQISRNQTESDNLSQEMRAIEHGDRKAAHGKALPVDQTKRTYAEQLRLYENADTNKRSIELKHLLQSRESDLKTALESLQRRFGEKKDDQEFKKELHAMCHMNSSEISDATGANKAATRENENRKTELNKRIGGLELSVKIIDELRDKQNLIEAACQELVSGLYSEDQTRDFNREIKDLKFTIAELKTAMKKAETNITEINQLKTSLEGLENRLSDALGTQDTPVEPVTVSDSNWPEETTSSLRSLKETKKDFGQKNADVKKHHDDIAKLINSNSDTLENSGIKSRINDMRDYEEHGDIAHILAEKLDQSVKAGEARVLRTEKSRESLISSVTKVLDDAISKVTSASSVKVPVGESAFSGHPLIKLPKSIDRTALAALPRSQIATQYIEHQIADTKRTQIRSASRMSVDLLKLVAKAHGQESFCLRVLKPVDHTASPTWEEIHKMTGSGGQTITAALLLVMVASTMNNDETGGSHQSFMILDNPIGKANKPSLVGLQLEMAKIFDIQMISTSGINDRYLSKYEWIVSFNVATRVGKTQETSVSYSDNIVENLTHRLKSPATGADAA